MQVILAGYNLDCETIARLRAGDGETDPPTPETIAAAYARISRSPKPVDELRAEARGNVAKARQSNRNIVFEMGHSSIAEHAVFNLDILGVSRLLVEDIESFRLCSYTEKSQRYVLFQDDFVLPGEIRGTGLEGAYVETIRAQQEFKGRVTSVCGPMSSPDIPTWRPILPIAPPWRAGPRKTHATPLPWRQPPSSG
jgi:hypothetical protein